jgi:hypothetical protein
MRTFTKIPLFSTSIRVWLPLFSSLLSGNGVFSKALHEHLKPKSHILLDRLLRNKSTLSPLVQSSKGTMKLFDLDGWDFNSYAELIKRKILNPESQPISKVNSSLIIVGNFTESNLRRADGFVAQLINFMFTNAFLYHYGTVKTLIWMRKPAWCHLFGQPGSTNRKKVTVMRELICNARVIARTVKTATKKTGLGSKSGEEPPLENEKEIIKLNTDDATRGVLVYEN